MFLDDLRDPMPGDALAVFCVAHGKVEEWLNVQTGGVEPFVSMPVVNGRMPRYQVMVEA